MKSEKVKIGRREVIFVTIARHLHGEEMTDAVVVVVVIVLSCWPGQDSLHMLRPISEKK